MSLISANTAFTLLNIIPRQLYEFVLSGVPIYDRDGDSLLFLEEPQARRIEMLSLAMEANTSIFEENIKGFAVITTTYKVLDRFEFSASRSLHDMKTLVSLRATKEAKDFFSFPLHDKKLIEFCSGCFFQKFELEEAKKKYTLGIIEKVYPDISWDVEESYPPEFLPPLGESVPTPLPGEQGEKQGMPLETLPLPEVKIQTQKRKNWDVTQKAMAKMCHVSESAVKKWDKGKAPKDYPGRYDLAVANQFAQTYRGRRAVNRQGRAMNRASTGYDVGSMGDYGSDE